jgi:hypothetical protein
MRLLARTRRCLLYLKLNVSLPCTCFASIPKLKPARALPVPVTKITTLPNKLRVATEETYGQVCFATVALMVSPKFYMFCG